MHCGRKGVGGGEVWRISDQKLIWMEVESFGRCGMFYIVVASGME